MLLAESESTPEELRDAVTSAGGTTAAALKVMEEGKFRELLKKAICAAKDRSLELAQE
jgi:pyrroline-5-carboxylate reductase